MKKKLILILLGLIILLLYLIIGSKFHIFIECPIYKHFHVYCPGCGLTRMLLSILKLDLYQAFRYNPLVFIMTPFIIFFAVEKMYSEYKNKKSIYKSVPNYIWYVVIVILIVYAVLRNIFPYLAPTAI